MNFTPEAEFSLLGRWFPEGVPYRLGVPDAWEISERLMSMSSSRAQGSDGRVQESELMAVLALHVIGKYGKRLVH